MAEWRMACDDETLAWQRRGWTRAEAGTHRLGGPEPEALLHALGAALNGRARAGDVLRLVLGSHYMRVAALPWPRERLATGEQGALLRQRWQARLDDVDAWWLGVESAGEVRLATAIRHDLLQALAGEMSKRRIRGRACLPATGLALRGNDIPADGRIAVAEGSRETIVTLSGGRLASLVSCWRAPAPLSAAASNHAADIRIDGGPQRWLDCF